MTGIMWIAAALLVAAEPNSPAQPGQSHQQHQASAEHQPAAATGDRCCCSEEMMHKMMMEMMQKHQGVEHPSAGTPPKGSEHEHQQ